MRNPAGLCSIGGHFPYITNGSVIERLGCLSAMCRETLRQYGVLRRILSSLGGSRTVPRCGTLDYKGGYRFMGVYGLMRKSQVIIRLHT